MNRRLFRILASVTIVVITALTTIAIPEVPSALASDEPPQFTLTVFPHNTDDVHFSNSWGNRRPGGRRHKGIDIGSPRGTEIVAVADGVVTAMGESRLPGYYIRIDHGNGWATSYMHLNNDTHGTDDGEGGPWTAFFPTLMEGDEVTAGQVIGYVGDSGNAEGTITHTHFEIKFEGEKINPYPYLKEVWDRSQRFPATDLVPL